VGGRPIGVAKDSNAAQAHGAGCPENAHGDFAAIGDEERIYLPGHI
jgi:hypothetical protein